MKSNLLLVSSLALNVVLITLRFGTHASFMANVGSSPIQYVGQISSDKSTPSGSPTTAPLVKEVEIFANLPASDLEELHARLLPIENEIATIQAAAAQFADASDYARLSSLEKSRLQTIATILGDDPYRQYLLQNTAIGQQVKRLTAELNLSENDQKEIIKAASDGLSLDQDKALDWIEKNHGFKLALAVEMANDSRMPQITGFQARHGLRQGTPTSVLNNLRCLEMNEATMSQRDAALRSLKESIPSGQWDSFAQTFQIINE